MSIDEEIARREQFVEYKGIKLHRCAAAHQFWSVIGNSAAELDGVFTDLRNAKEAIDRFLERKELEGINFNANGDR
jgi:hypothetical protein